MALDTQHIPNVVEPSTQKLTAAEHREHIAVDDRLKSRPARVLALPAVRFVLHYLEMQIVMGLGMGLFSLLLLGLRAWPAYAVALATGSDLWIVGDGLFMSIPMMAWMIFRGHGWQPSLEMAASMLVPGLAIILLGWLGIGVYLPWLATSACGVMCLGMLAYMLLRYEHFSSHASHAAHAGPKVGIHQVSH